MAVCLIGCSASKASAPMPARRLYTGDLFKKSLRWAESCGRFSSIKVLSAAHGLVDLERVIAPYDTTLHAIGADGRREWAERIAYALVPLLGQHSEIVALAGRLYTEGLALHLQVLVPGVVFSRPLAGMGLGEQKAWLKKELASPGDAPSIERG